MNVLKSTGIFLLALLAFRTILWLFLRDINEGYAPGDGPMLIAWVISFILAAVVWWRVVRPKGNRLVDAGVTDKDRNEVISNAIPQGELEARKEPWLNN